MSLMWIKSEGILPIVENRYLQKLGVGQDRWRLL